MLQFSAETARVAFDASDNLYVGCAFTVPMNLGDGMRTPNRSDVIVAKYAPSMALLWSRSFGGDANDRVSEMHVGGDHLFISVSSSDFATGESFRIDGWIMDPFQGEHLVALNLDGAYLWGLPFFGGINNARIAAAGLPGHLLMFNLQPSPFFWQLLSP